MQEPPLARQRARALLRRLAPGFAGLAGLAAAWLAWPDSMAQYLVRAAWHQGTLLWAREPVEGVLASGQLDPRRAQALATSQRIKAFGAELGLSSTDNYDALAVGWEKTIWNATICAPDSFEPRTLWFPIVGTVPYLGFFDEAEARRYLARHGAGQDVFLRTAGAYSTLGWFRDPLLPAMLDWPEHELANTILHELAHATLWIPGSVAFNESFASVVGDKAARAWIVHAHGADSPEAQALDGIETDRLHFRRMLHGVWGELDAVYSDPALSRREKLIRKREIIGTIPHRTARLPLRQPQRWVAFVQREPWNNARLVQFQTYNEGPEWFEALYAQEGGDLMAFIRRVDELTRDADDPFAALAAAVGATPTP